MRRATLALALAAALAAALPATAPAQGGGSFVIGPEPTSFAAPVDVSGAMSVEFRGDEATGCAERRICDVSGTIVWSPGREAFLAISEQRAGGRRHVDAVLALVGDTRTSAIVDRPGGRCSDLRPEGFAILPLESRSSRTLLVSLGGPPGPLGPLDPVSTRCAGPLARDLRDALPAARVPLRSVLRGRVRIDLGGEREFAVGGLAGTVRSTLALRVGRGERGGGEAGEDLDDLDDSIGRQRERIVSVAYRVEEASGSIATRFAGVGDALVCGPLDACGLAGELETALASTRGTVELYATAPASRPRRDLLTALGLVRGGRTAGVRVDGVGALGGGAQLSATLSRDGAAACADRTRVRTPYVALAGRERGIRVELTVPFGGPDPLRTRCPGPLAADLAGSDELAHGTVRRRTFARRRVVLRLRGGRPLQADGYTGATAPDVTIVLRRLRVRDLRLDDFYFFGPAAARSAADPRAAARALVARR